MRFLITSIAGLHEDDYGGGEDDEGVDKIADLFRRDWERQGQTLRRPFCERNVGEVPHRVGMPLTDGWKQEHDETYFEECDCEGEEVTACGLRAVQCPAFGCFCVRLPPAILRSSP